MSYLALYRKFRPDSFGEVKGQEHVITTLKNQLAHDRVGHAYLLCGTRGTGKTTVAKLIAKTVNCENPTEDGPCGVCDSCKSIAEGSSLNVIEIDAASHNGVDNIRQINEAVQYSPAQGKYLVYIIDEAHQLSKGAYNALLKTLEEPPEYVIFILATTDDYSLPVTIKSRCQRFDFHRISIDTIVDRLQEIVTREGETATQEALRYIAHSADGSMRDALSILDECMSASIGEVLDKDRVLSVIGAVSVDIYIRMLKAVTENKPEEVLNIINQTIWDGKDLVKFCDDYTWFIRNTLFLKLSPEIGDELDMSDEAINELKELGAGFSTDMLVRHLNILQETCSDIRKSSVKRVTLEMAFIKMMRSEMNVDYGAILERLDKLEKGGIPQSAEGAPSQTTDPGLTSQEVEALVNAAIDRELARKVERLNLSQNQTYDSEVQSDIVKENIVSHFPQAEREDILELARSWRSKIVPKLTNPHKEYSDELNVEPALTYKQDGTMGLNLVFDDRDKDSVTYLYYENKKNRDSLAECISGIIGKSVEVGISTRKGIKGVIDRESLAINKVNFNVQILEREEDRNG